MSNKLVIIGGVAGGATAAARARRLDEFAEIILFERGEFISFANCGLPYYIGGIIEERDDLLVTTREMFMNRYDVEIRTLTEVTAIDTEKKEVEAKNLRTGEVTRESYDKIILSPGAEPFLPPLPGIDMDGIFHLRNIPDSDRIKEMIDVKKPEAAVVVGGGFIGLEMAENLAHRGVKTTVIELMDQVMAPLDKEMASLIHARIRGEGMELELGNGVESFTKEDDRIVVSTTSGKKLVCDMVILSIGIRPENKLAIGAGLELAKNGAIKVDGSMRTSDPDIYAVGDAVEVRDLVTGRLTMTALAGPANKQARVAADNAMGRKAVFKGTLGTSIVKVFNMTVAVTGANEKQLKKADIPYISSYTHSGSHAGYYPGATDMVIKLLFRPSNGMVLGAQIIGEEGVDKRIDVLATAIHAGMTVFDLEELELAYAPPYSSAKDPVNIAGFVGANILKGDVENIYWHELSDLDQEKYVLLDLRMFDELEASGTIDEAQHVPLMELRMALEDFDKEKTYITVCAIGLRGYLGYRILTQNGFKAKSLSGGFKTLLGSREEILQEVPNIKLYLNE